MIKSISRIGLCFLCFICLFKLNAQEQTSDTELSEIRKNKNHLDVDIKNIFQGLENASLIYKRKISTGKFIDVNAIKLIRFSASFTNQITFTESPNRNLEPNAIPSFHPSDITDISIGIGFEKQIKNNDFVHYYGVEGFYGILDYSNSFSRGPIGGVINSSVSSIFDVDIKIYRIGLQPFTGIKYYLTKKLSVGIETSFQLMYFKQNVLEYERRVTSSNTPAIITESGPFIADGVLLQFNNLRFLTIGYVF